MNDSEEVGKPAGARRFYKAAQIEPVDGGYAILLDGRPVKTPARAPFVVPGRLLAERIAGEWSAQDVTIRPETMPHTGLANAAIDRIGTGRESVIERIAAYLESEPVCFRAEGPNDLVAREAELWDPLVEAFNRRFDVALKLSTGLSHVSQDDAVSDRVKGYAAARDDFALTALLDAVTHLGSLVVAVAAIEGDIDAEAAFQAAYLEELHQADRWGLDKEAEDRRRAIRNDVATALEFARLVAQG